MPGKMFILAVLVLAGTCLAENTNLATDSPSFPYKAQVIGKGVYVRSGAASQFYFTSQLDEPAMVTVVDKRFSWCKIVPPAGSFSWIAKEFVVLDSTQPGYGVVTNSDVRVWAGKPDLGPEDSTSPQCKIDKGEKVKLLGEESGDYYKIAPPKEAYLWINGEFLKYAGPADASVKLPKIAESNAVTAATKPADSNTLTAVDANAVIVAKDSNAIVDINSVTVKLPEPKTPSVVTREPKTPIVVKSDHEIEMTRKVRGIIKQVNDERKKPANKQNFDQFVGELKAIESDGQAGMAIEYAKYQLGLISGYHLANQVDSNLGAQQSELEKIRKEIQERRLDLRSKLSIEGGYLVAGKFKKSVIYRSKAGVQRYLIADEQGKILCFAEAADDLKNADMSSYTDQIVGLKGDVLPDKVSGMSVVKFTSIEIAKTSK